MCEHDSCTSNSTHYHYHCALCWAYNCCWHTTLSKVGDMLGVYKCVKCNRAQQQRIKDKLFEQK